ncbi:enolase C-terminal domain-like protein [Paenibacillus solisilvae]|uniref:Enolase C-terminal domain-like protein n=1 Tax=Paenibacillus solisilvae TaxID=2486751 RepID=A0ABW0VPG4_9BACL
MDRSRIDPSWKIERIEFARLTGERARIAGANARIGVHGKNCAVDIARVTIDGEAGYGVSFLSEDRAKGLIGRTVSELFDENGLLLEPYRLLLEYPLLDFLGKRWNQPVYELAARDGRATGEPQTVPCYDTSLYFDDLHLDNEKDAVALMQEEARQGFVKGHRNFKIKVGRGNRYMPVWEGTKRDIAIVWGVQEVAGPEGKIMIDANNGYNLNLTKDVLAALSDVNLYWIEEMFHEDEALYSDLRAWLNERSSKVLIADGEGLASPYLVDWAIRGNVDVLQYDIIHPGFTHWLELGAKLDSHGLFSAPHCYGNAYGIYASGHLAAAIKGFQFVEYDEIAIAGMDVSAYEVKDGLFYVPNKAGFGIDFDAELFASRVKQGGWSV